MEPAAAVEPGHIELLGRELWRGAAVGRHRALAVRPHKGDHDAGLPGHSRPQELDPARLEQRPGERSGLVVRLLADEPRLLAELGDPGRHVRRLPAGGHARLDRRVRTDCHRVPAPGPGKAAAFAP